MYHSSVLSNCLLYVFSTNKLNKSWYQIKNMHYLETSSRNAIDRENIWNKLVQYVFAKKLKPYIYIYWYKPPMADPKKYCLQHSYIPKLLTVWKNIQWNYVKTCLIETEKDVFIIFPQWNTIKKTKHTCWMCLFLFKQLYEKWDKNKIVNSNNQLCN